MKAANYIFFVYSVLCAFLQFNDPDPYLWAPLYLVSAWLSILAVKAKYAPLSFICCIVTYLVLACWIVFSPNGPLDWWILHRGEGLLQNMQAAKPWVESAREFFGLMILVAVHSCNLLWLRKKSQRPAAVILPLVR